MGERRRRAIRHSRRVADATDVANQVKYWYDELSQVAREYQAHGGLVDDDEQGGNDSPYVGYTYDDSETDDVYDNAMRLTKVRYPNGRLVHYTYGDNTTISGKLSRIDAIRDDDSGDPQTGWAIAKYAYNGVGRIVVEDFQQPDVRLDRYDDYDASAQDGVYAGLDRYGRVTSQLWRDYNNDEDLDKFSYGYNCNSSPVWREVAATHAPTTPDQGVNQAAIDELYTYDKLGRLTQFERGDLNANKDAMTGTKLREEDYTLSTVGNWTGYSINADGSAELAHTREHNLANEIEDTDSNGDAIETSTGNDWINPVHDAAGNMTSGPSANTPNGSTMTCKYDAWNRLAYVSWSSDERWFCYDGLGRQVHEARAWNETLTTVSDYYYNAAWQMLQEDISDESSDRTTVADDTKIQHVWSLRYIDSPILRDSNEDADGLCDDQRWYFTNDANFNVTTVIDDTGAIQRRMYYDPYGQLHSCEESEDGQGGYVWADGGQDTDYGLYLFAGYRIEPYHCFYHVRNRAYHPRLGRWFQRDPIGYLPGMNMYAYVGGRPGYYVDPFGLDEDEKDWKDKSTGEKIKDVGGTAVQYLGPTELLGGGAAALQAGLLYADPGAKMSQLRGDVLHAGLDPNQLYEGPLYNTPGHPEHNVWQVDYARATNQKKNGQGLTYFQKKLLGQVKGRGRPRPPGSSNSGSSNSGSSNSGSSNSGSSDSGSSNSGSSDSGSSTSDSLPPPEDDAGGQNHGGSVTTVMVKQLEFDWDEWLDFVSDYIHPATCSPSESPGTVISGPYTSGGMIYEEVVGENGQPTMRIIGRATE